MTNLSISTANTAPLSPLSPIQQVDWQAPWLQHLTYQPFMVDATDAIAQSSVFSSVAAYLNQGLTQAKDKALMAKDKPSETSSNSVLTSGRGQTLKFVAQEDLPEGMAYETFIATTGQVPTRENLHDLFNGSIWLTFPQSKALKLSTRLVFQAVADGFAIPSRCLMKMGQF